MAGAAVPGRLSWLPARVVDARPESSAARRIVLDVPGWPGHLPGQHLVLRLTAEDGYVAQRSYSIASAADGPRVELVVERLADGEVSPYLVDDLVPGDEVEVRGPVGLHLVWRPTDPGPVQLVAGGSGVVPFLAVLEERRRSGSTVPVRLLCSARSPDALVGRDVLVAGGGAEVTLTWTRRLPPDWRGPTGRVDAAMLRRHAFPPSLDPAVLVCGPSGFVEAVSSALVDLGHRPERVRTERFGASGTPVVSTAG